MGQPQRKKVLVIGESCTDRFVYGTIKRLAPEAPAPVLLPKATNECTGMAGNVFKNLESLGVTCDIITNDNHRGVVKTRYVDERTNTLLLRVDEGEHNVKPIQMDFGCLGQYDIIVISDYCKGFLPEQTISMIGDTHPFVFLDTKKILGDWCHSVFVIKINSEEYESSRRIIENDDILKSKIINTGGLSGCAFRENVYPVERVDVKDLAGAGDTFLAGLVKKYLETGSIDQSIDFANTCATLAVQSRGVFSDLSCLVT